MGVDMMICRTGKGFRLHPCVEINMRMNMGLVARRFFDRFVHADSEGIYRIGYFKREGEALKFHGEQQKPFLSKSITEKFLPDICHSRR